VFEECIGSAGRLTRFLASPRCSFRGRTYEEGHFVMARRIVIIGLFVVLAQLATGCHICEHFRAKKHFKHHGYGYADPCSCSCASGTVEAPIIPGDSLPAPKKMPSATMNSRPVLTSFDK
jgi:hypothetical protein